MRSASSRSKRPGRRGNWSAPARNDALVAALQSAVGENLAQAFQIRDKLQRRDAIAALKKDTLESLAATAEAKGWSAGDLAKEFADLEYTTMRQGVLKTKQRIDGRNLDDVRPITIRVGVLPRTHGSALFTRGETQALVTVTLGTTRDSQIVDAPEGESKDPFLFHYNFPPFSVGETGRMAGPKRRESARPSRQARRAGGQAVDGSIPLRRARRLGDHRIERLVVDGVGLRLVARDDGRGRSAEVAGRGYRDGPRQGRRGFRRALGHPR